MPQIDTSARDPRRATAPPAVSVIIPAYNSTLYISEALDSVFAQTFSDYEVIVVNDGSPDTVDLERVLVPYRDSIIYIKQGNRGPSAARNRAIKEARGEYVALLDSDDAWLPQHLAEQVRALRRHHSLDLIYADAALFGDSVRARQTFMQTSPSRGPVTFESLLRWECSIITSCVVARRQSLIDAGLFDENFFHTEDFDLWLRLAHRGGHLTYQRQVLARHRLRANSLAAEITRMNRSRVEVLRKAACTLILSPAERELLTAQIAECEAFVDLEDGRQQFMTGQYGEAAEALARANDYYQSRKIKIMLLALRVAPRLFLRLYGLRSRLYRQGAAVMRGSKPET